MSADRSSATRSEGVALDPAAHRVVDLEPALVSVFEGADHVDVATADGSVSLRTFLAGMLSYYPRWMQVLYAIRWLFVRLLGLSQDGLPDPSPVLPSAVPFTPGESFAFFTVRRTSDGRYWVGEASESHLTATICVLAEPRAGGSRFHVCTAVRYHRPVGRLYFAVVRPFHYLVIDRMVAAGVSPERCIGPAVVNVHERCFDAPIDSVGDCLDSLSTADDVLWPTDPWPPMELDGPLQVGSRGGHGPVRYEVEAYDPGSVVQFRFTAPENYSGFHRFEVESRPTGGVWLRHVVRLRISGSARLSWPLLDRWMHDALIEDAFDRAARAVGTEPVETRWPYRVRVAVWLYQRL